jgi:aminopeptidase YwaD
MVQAKRVTILFTLAACWTALAQPAGQPPAQEPPPTVTPQSLVERDRIVDMLRALPTKRCVESDEEHADGLAATEVLLVERLKAIGVSPTLEPLSWTPPTPAAGEPPSVRPREWNNVVAEFPGTAVATRDVLVIGAHFDALPNVPGADDNGSGVAALMELARVYHSMRAAGWTHTKTIRLVFFNLEEVGLVGSKHHLTQWRAEKERNKQTTEPAGGEAKPLALQAEQISLMISLECLGYYSDAPGSQTSPFPAIPGVFEPPTVGDNIVLVTIAKHQEACKSLAAGMLASAPGLKVFRADFSPLPLPDLMRSDHAPFIMAGIPSIMITDTANFRNPNYHKPTDTIDTLDFARLTLTTKGVAGAVWELAGPQAPATPAK